MPCLTRSSATTEITRVGGHDAVQDHSRQLILVQIEGQYATPCYSRPIAHRFQIIAGY